jgi:hypothetical protein
MDPRLGRQSSRSEYLRSVAAEWARASVEMSGRSEDTFIEHVTVS